MTYDSKLQFELQPHWPPAAWIAEQAGDGRPVTIKHGPAVCTGDLWFGELVWDGEFADAQFDQTDIVYGTGGKITDEGLLFVSSATTMDRLQYWQAGERWLVSNSLVCLMWTIDAELEPLSTSYRPLFESIIQGLDFHQRQLKTSRGDIELVYHDNLLVTEHNLLRRPKPRISRDFSSYEAYRDFLESSLQRCARNMQDSDRSIHYEWLGTISTGFDSPGVAALAKSAGLNEVVTFTRARGGGDDDGSEIANMLGLTATAIDRDQWQSHPLTEVPFLASDAKGEDVYFAGLLDRLDRKVLLTGYAAGAWKASGKVSNTLKRADQSGLSLTEYRLWANFIHLPVPTMGVYSTSTEGMQKLSQDLAPWKSGEKYDKAFCRRLLEEQGIPAEMYGGKKKAASVLMFDRRSLLSPESKREYLSHLRRVRGGQPLVGLQRQLRDMTLSAASRVVQLGQQTTRGLASLIPLRAIRRVAESDRIKEYAHYEPLVDYLFPWAMTLAKQRYSAPSVSKPTSSAAESGGKIFARNS